MIITTDLEWYQTVYLLTDPDQRPRLLTNLVLNGPHCVMYGLSCGTQYTEHYREEIATEKDQVQILTNAGE